MDDNFKKEIKVGPGPEVPAYDQRQGQAQGQAQAVTTGEQYRDQLFAQCAQGNHEKKREYGMFGIITAICFFPLGLICLFANSKMKCERCGVYLEK